MVNFGAHLAASRVSGWEAYYVSWDSLRSMSVSKKTNPAEFLLRWLAELAKCEGHFKVINRAGVNALFAMKKENKLAEWLVQQLPGLSKSNNRGYTWLDNEIILEECTSEQELFQRQSDALDLQAKILPHFDQMRAFALINIEALRKLACKLEKYVCRDTATLMFGELTTSALNHPLEAFSTALRATISVALLSGAQEEAKQIEKEKPPAAPSKASSKAVTSKVDNQFDFLRSLVGKLDESVRATLVSHRGFHHKTDDLSRPLENTLAAYEQSWAAGLLYCECDVALTLDGTVVLCHDNNLNRLASDPLDSRSHQHVTHLTYEEITLLSLKNGTAAPTLREVLSSAMRINRKAKLVIEIKSGSEGSQIAAAICHLLKENLRLLQHVEIVMSFDLFLLHTFGHYMKSVFADLPQEKLPKLMFLTRNFFDNPEAERAEREKNPIENSIDWSNPQLVRAQVEKWMSHGPGRLDGVYVQFHQSMLVDGGATQATLADLLADHVLGVWGARSDPDSLKIAETLSKKCGFRYVNTDLPEDFSDSLSADGRES